MVGEGLLVGLLGGGVITLYRIALSTAERTLRQITGMAAGNALLMLAWFGVLALLCLVVGLLVMWEPYTGGSGIPQVDAEVMGHIDMPWHRVMLAKFVEGTLCAFGGLSLGREGPSVQLGAVSGKAVSRLFDRDRGEERLLVTCGAAAGMSAAFHAPLAGVLFALEEIHKEFSAPLILTVMTSSVAADFLVSNVLGVAPVVSFSFAADIPHSHYPLLILLGVVCGLVGALHNEGMFFCQEKLFSHIDGSKPFARYAVAFAVAGIAAFAAPDLMCGGDAIIEKIMHPETLGFATVLALLLGKYLMTTICFGSGAPGGTLFPLVVLGSLVGLLFGKAFATMDVAEAYVMNFVVMGIAGLFASVVRAPVSAVVLCFELTGSLDALLAVTVVSIVSYVTASLTRVEPYYEHLLGNLLGVTPADPYVNDGREHILHSYHVGTGSFAEGKLVSEVPWPNGALVVNITRTDKNIIPRGNTQLMPLDELTVSMNVATMEDTDLIVRKLCEGSAHWGDGSQGKRGLMERLFGQREAH